MRGGSKPRGVSIPGPGAAGEDGEAGLEDPDRGREVGGVRCQVEPERGPAHEGGPEAVEDSGHLPDVLTRPRTSLRKRSWLMPLQRSSMASAGPSEAPALATAKEFSRRHEGRDHVIAEFREDVLDPFHVA